MTAEQGVKKKYPKAYSFRYRLGNMKEYRIFKSKRSEVELSGWHKSESGAWADVLHRIKAGGKA